MRKQYYYIKPGKIQISKDEMIFQEIFALHTQNINRAHLLKNLSFVSEDPSENYNYAVVLETKNVDVMFFSTNSESAFQLARAVSQYRPEIDILKQEKEFIVVQSPTFTGNDARTELTFECRDYRSVFTQEQLIPLISNVIQDRRLHHLNLIYRPSLELVEMILTDYGIIKPKGFEVFREKWR